MPAFPRRPLAGALAPGAWCLAGLAGLAGCGGAPGTPAGEPGTSTPAEGLAQPVEATSLDGRPLLRRPLASEPRAELEANLAEARANLAADPSDPHLVVWVGRRLGYLGRYQEAIEAFSRGIEAHPDHAALRRHRGHRYITVRRFADAVTDLERATELIAGRPDEIEADGMPNAAGIPRGTLHFAIWYHLGLAYYLQGDFENAARAYRECLDVARNDDKLVAASDWLYMTYRRLGLDAEAAALLEPISADMEILENFAYHRRLQLYRGEIESEALLAPDGADAVQLATQGYGVGNWHLYNGRPDRAREIFRQIVAGDAWAAFGYIAAEADLHRDFP